MTDVNKVPVTKFKRH